LEVEFVLGVLLTLMTMTLIVKENVLSRICEHIALGIGGGYAAVMAVKYVIDKGSAAVAKGDYTIAVTFVLGFMLYSRFVKEGRYLARYPVAVMIGTLLGLASRAALDTQIVRQLADASTVPAKAGPMQLFDFIVVLGSTIAVLLYFTFVASPTGRLGSVKAIGRYLLLVGFGATFGNMIMGVFSRLMDRIMFLMGVS